MDKERDYIADLRNLTIMRDKIAKIECGLQRFRLEQNCLTGNYVLYSQCRVKGNGIRPFPLFDFY